MPKLKIKMTDFSLKVIGLIKKIPSGKVATYGQIAVLAGKPGSARAVGWILNSCTESHKLPWQRVLNSKGQISFHIQSEEYAKQKRLLKREGVHFSEAHTLDLKLYRWNKVLPKSKSQKGTPRMFE